MKFKHWLLWYVFMLIGIVDKLMKEIPLHHSLSQMGWSSFMLPFLAGTFGVAIAFLWARIDE